jgi:anaerobic selenocysteine-containing dehydrogenase
MLMYGSMWWIPTPDVRRTQYWVIIGGNPQASQGSLLACPDVLGEIDRLRARGGKTVVVDPRRTGTADHADEWIPIRPGTDAAFLLALCQVLFADGLVRPGPLAERVRGTGEVRALAAPFTPERVEATCRIPAATIRRLAHEIAAAPSAAVYGRIGTCNQEFGTLASWLVDVVNILTGNFDRPGGLMFGNPIAWGVSSLPDPQWAGGVSFGRFRSRVRGVPEVLGQFPLSCLAEEIATPGDGSIRGLVTIAGNPVLSAPDSARLDAALPGLECMISVDNALNETTRHAHVILPGHSALEQAHFDDLISIWAVRSAGKYSPAVFPPDGRPEEWQILTMLAGLCAGMRLADIDVDAIDDGFFSALCLAKGVDASTVMPLYDRRGPERLLDLQIRTGPFGDRYGERPNGLTLESFRAAPHGIDAGPLVPRLDEVLATPSGKIELAPPYITADVERLAARLDRRDDGMVLVSRRHLRSNNSWLHNIERLVRGRDRCTLLVHPDDAARMGLRDGERARVTRLGVARAHAGVNNNVLAPGRLVDPLSNNAVVNGIPVVVAPA